MREAIPETAADYLREPGRMLRGQAVAVRAPGWGVSKVVMRVDVEGEPPFVPKQGASGCGRRRTGSAGSTGSGPSGPRWNCSRRCFRTGTVPRILFVSPEDYLFAMTCAPDDSAVCTGRLLAGEADPEVARRAGASYVGAMHAETRDHSALGKPARWPTSPSSTSSGSIPITGQSRVHRTIAPRIELLIESLAHPTRRG